MNFFTKIQNKIYFFTMGYSSDVQTYIPVEYIIDREDMMDCYINNPEIYANQISFFRENLYSSEVDEIELYNTLKYIVKNEFKGIKQKLNVFLLYKILTITCVRKEIEKPKYVEFRHICNLKIDEFKNSSQEFGNCIEGFFNRFV